MHLLMNQLKIIINYFNLYSIFSDGIFIDTNNIFFTILTMTNSSEYKEIVSIYILLLPVKNMNLTSQKQWSLHRFNKC